MTENTGSYHDGCLIECSSASGCTDSDASRETFLVFNYASGKDDCLNVP